MENGSMDSNSKLASDTSHFIMDLGGKSVEPCFDSDSAVTFESVNNNSITSVSDIPSIDSNFTRCNGKANLDHCESINLLNREDTCNDCDGDLFGGTRKTNSSQCSLSFKENSVCANLDNELSSLSINESISESHCKLYSNQTSSFTDQNYERTRMKNELMEGSVEGNQSCDRGKRKISKEVFIGPDCDRERNSCSESEKENSYASEIKYISYESENQMPDIMKLIQKDLSEPYSIYTYRYFIHNWPHLCFLAISKGKSVGAIVCKLDLHRKVVKRGYIAMLAVDECYRKQGIGSNLVLKAIRVMAAEGADEVVLETEITNQPALRLYENLGFVRDKRLFRYYLNGVDALRLKLWLR